MRNGTITDIVKFQNNLTFNATKQLKTDVVLIKEKMQNDMDMYVLDHTIQL